MSRNFCRKNLCSKIVLKTLKVSIQNKNLKIFLKFSSWVFDFHQLSQLPHAALWPEFLRFYSQWGNFVGFSIYIVIVFIRILYGETRRKDTKYSSMPHFGCLPCHAVHVTVIARQSVKEGFAGKSSCSPWWCRLCCANFSHLITWTRLKWRHYLFTTVTAYKTKIPTKFEKSTLKPKQLPSKHL